MTFDPGEPRDEEGRWTGSGAKLPKAALRRKITELELRRDLRPREWNAARELELRDLKDAWLRKTGKAWRGV